jgi:opacity protein-like surface antigen
MGKFKALACASLLALLPQFAHAADLLPPVPNMESPMLRGSVEPESAFYLRGDVGVGINQVGKVDSTFVGTVPGFQHDASSLGDSPFVGFGAGYQFNSWFRADVTGEYRGSARYDGAESYLTTLYSGGPNYQNCSGASNGTTSPTRCPDIYSGSVSSAVFLANGYFDLGTWYGLTPYVGAGVGITRNKSGFTTDMSIGNTGGGYSTGAVKTDLAWALMAGLGYTVNSRLKLEFGYRYLDLGSYNTGTIVCQPVGVVGCTLESQRIKYASHDLRIGMRWMFADAAYVPPPAMPPLVRKY